MKNSPPYQFRRGGYEQLEGGINIAAVLEKEGQLFRMDGYLFDCGGEEFFVKPSQQITAILQL